MSSSPQQPSVGVPQWLFAIFVTAFLGAVGVIGAGIFAVRDTVREHELRIVALEEKTRETRGVEGRLITVEAKLDIILKAVLPPSKAK